MKFLLATCFLINVLFVGVIKAEDTLKESDQEIDLTLINDTNYDLSKPIFGVRPTLGRGLRDMQNSAGGSACTSCAH